MKILNQVSSTRIGLDSRPCLEGEKIIKQRLESLSYVERVDFVRKDVYIYFVSEMDVKARNIKAELEELINR